MTALKFGRVGSAGLLLLVLTAPSLAGEITFTKIADTNTAIPGARGNFTGFSSVSMNDGETAFVGTGSSWGGVYLFRNGVVTKIADQDTVMPDRGILLQQLLWPRVDQQQQYRFCGRWNRRGRRVHRHWRLLAGRRQRWAYADT